MKTVMKCLLCGICLLTLLIAGALAEKKAEDITSKCRFTSAVNDKKIKNIKSDNYKVYWDGGEKGSLRVTCPSGKKAQGVMVSVFRDVAEMTFVDTDGTILAEYRDRYATEYIPFALPSGDFEIRYDGHGVPVKINRLRVLGEGELPDWAQRWEELDGDAELMLISTHPDDEILWFGGMLPTYAGELGKKVIVVYMVGGMNGMRTSELLDGLWAMGVHTYPDIGALPDVTGASLNAARQHWGGDDVAPRRVTKAIRKYRPQVVATQAVNGEYGHYHHIITTQAAIDAVTRLAADPSYDPDSARAYGAHQVQKLYLHLWKEGQVKFDWRKPLRAFNGRTGLEVARQAFRMHASQRASRYRVHDSGRLDCSLFGLYYSAVGPDEKGDDLFEHIGQGDEDNEAV